MGNCHDITRNWRLLKTWINIVIWMHFFPFSFKSFQTSLGNSNFRWSNDKLYFIAYKLQWCEFPSLCEPKKLRINMIHTILLWQYYMRKIKFHSAWKILIFPLLHFNEESWIFYHESSSCKFPRCFFFSTKIVWKVFDMSSVDGCSRF